MKTYIIKIVEKIEKDVTVLAESEDNALKIVEDEYKNEKYVLDYSDYKSTDFLIKETSNEITYFK